MMRSLTARYAVRGLGRQLRRTALSALGVGIGCAIGLITIAWIRGEKEMIIRAAAECGAGHLRIVAHDWPQRRDRNLRVSDWQKTLAEVRGMPEVAVATPRTRVQGLLGLGTRVLSSEIVGVDPDTEQASLRFVRQLSAGRYLRPGERGVAVVGRGVLERLDGRLDDELLITAMDVSGQMQSMLVVVVGVATTGSDNIDRSLVQVPLADAETLSGVSGAGEITILLKDRRASEAVQKQLERLVPDGQRVLPWQEVTPELLAGYRMDQGFARVTVGLIVVLVLLGVMSAQLTSVLERRKEFAVLSALGMGGGMMIRVVLFESVSLGLLGTLIGLGLGLPFVYYLATTGVDLASAMGEGDMAMSGVLVDPVFYADMGAWVLPYALVLSLTATVLSALYPALYASRTDPAEALRVAQ